jgi:cytochrome c oxidase assembly protein subunit 15
VSEQALSNAVVMDRTPRVARRSYLFGIAFGTTVAMWAIGYLCRLSPGVPSWFVLALMVVCLFVGGGVAGAFTPGGWRSGAAVGLVVSLVNLLVLGSLVSGPTPNSLVPSAILWIPGSFAVGALVSALGGAAGRRIGLASRGVSDEPAVNWTGAFAAVAAVATFFLVIVGGVVTGHEAGLAVVDWPNSYGYNMFLYPLSRMTGGIYFEHAHRLFGSLVGLTTLVLMVHLLRVEKRGWLKGLSIVAFVMVVVQGILGGLRVTGGFTSSTSPEAVAPSLPLAVVHGVFAQIFFAVMVAIALFTSTGWRRREAGIVRPSAGTDRALSAALVVLLIVQLMLGAFQRHFERGILLHIGMAAVVTVVAVVVGARAWGVRPNVDLLERQGPRLIGLVVLQLMLGVGALAVTTMAADAPSPPAWEVAVTTAHQATGAALLAMAVIVLLWTYRLLAPPKPSATALP